MKTFTFLMRDWSEHVIEAPDKDEAFRILCRRLGRSWISLHAELLDAFEHVQDGIERE